jgi:type VI secretion system protein ImpH
VKKAPDLFEEPWRFDMFATLRRVERDHPDRPRIGDNAKLADEYVAISQNPYLEFPASTLEAAERESGGRLRLTARFLGMFGPQGALPLATTAEVYGWLRERDDAFARFVDIFQRRFLALFFRAWSDARPIAQHDRPDKDRFVAYIGSMIGIGTRAYQNRDSLSDFAKLEYAGLLGPRVKSASRLRSFLAGLFNAKVEIDEFVGSWLALDKGDQSRLGSANARLGVDAMVGANVFSVGDRFRVRLYARDLEQYQRFLPGSDFARELADAVSLYIGREYDWDLELAIPSGKVVSARLGKGAKLGWTTWMSPNWADSVGTYRRDARFHLMSRAQSAPAGHASQ